MSEPGAEGGALVGRFADFYEEVAQIKVACAEGRLAALLGRELPAQASGNDFAAAVSGRLAIKLQRRAGDRDGHGAAEERRVEVARYVMASLADEIFILDLDWPGRSSWLSHLLERALFKHDRAGDTFFDQLDELLRSHGRNEADADLAAVFLLALQLGFQGEHRGAQGRARLERYRADLLRFIDERRAEPPAGDPRARCAFPQAYAHTVGDQGDRRIAPLGPWLRAAVIGIVLWLVVSTVIWFWLLSPLVRMLGAFEGE